MYVKTKRLELRPIGDGALEALTELLTDESVAEFYMVPDFADRTQAQALAQRLTVLSEDPSRYVAGIFLEDQLIGLLNETEVSGDSIEVGYAMLPRHQGQGYGTEALTGAIEYFFGQGFAQVEAGAFEENAASVQVMRKSGMTKLDRQDTVPYRGKEHRCVYYCVRK